MMNQTQPPKSQESNANRAMLDRIVKACVKNWGFKVLALLIAVVLWAGLIAQDPTLTREKEFTNVTLNITGQDTMKRNGFIVTSDLSKLVAGATLVADVPQRQYSNAVASTYNARIDLSKIKATGRQTLSISTTNSTVYGSVVEVEPAAVTLTVEEYTTRYRIPVIVTMKGDAPSGYYATTPSIDPPMIAVSGPKTIVDLIVRAEAVLDLATLPAQEGEIRTAVKLQLKDAEGKTIKNDLLEITSESVLLDSVVLAQNLYTQKVMNLSDLAITTGKPAKGYEVKQVSISPMQIVAAGNAIDMEGLETLFAEAAVSVEGRSESFTQQVNIRKPGKLKYMSANTLTVAVEIGPVITEKVFERQKVNIANLPSDVKANMENNRTDVTVTGPQLWLESLRSGDLTLAVDASGLPAGVYELPVICTVANSAGQTYTVQTSPAFLQVEITNK